MIASLLIWMMRLRGFSVSDSTSLFRVTLDLSGVNVGMLVDVSFREFTKSSDDYLEIRAKKELFRVVQDARPRDIVVDEIVEVERFGF